MGAERWFLDCPLIGLGQGDHEGVHGETHNRRAFSICRGAEDLEFLGTSSAALPPTTLEFGNFLTAASSRKILINLKENSKDD